MKKIISFILLGIFLFHCTEVFAAAAAVARRKQAIAAQQRAIEEEIYKQQYQAHQQAVYEQQSQAVQQQAIEQQIIQQYQEAQKQAVEQILFQIQQEKIVYEQVKAVRQAQAEFVSAQQMAEASALAKQYQEAVIAQAIQQNIVLDAAKRLQIEQMARQQAEIAAMQAMQMRTQAQTFAAGQGQGANPNLSDKVEDIVDITDVWKKLDVNSRAWTLLIDNDAKVATVKEFLDRFRNHGVRIQGSPTDYVDFIDQMAVQNPSLLTNPFKNLLQLAAVMQYDFDNGMDRDELARKMLGEHMYQSNRRRLGK